MKIAIIGSGISGLTSAYVLRKSHDITLFEGNDYVGGHTHTVQVRSGSSSLNIDTGFIVFNDWTYPNFIRLLELLDVASAPSSMGFSISCEATGYEYSGDSLSGLFAQRGNIFNPSHYRMILDMIRFFRDGKRFLNSADEQTSLDEFLHDNHYSERFVYKFIVPMMSAIWSASPGTVSQFPAAHFLRFFRNHGLLNIRKRPTWRTVEGGSSQYVEKIKTLLGDRIRLNTPVKKIERQDTSIQLHLEGESPESFDHVIVAAHSDQALNLLSDPSKPEREILGAIKYQDNEVVLHTDTKLLPANKRAWSSWNYHLLEKGPERAVLTYNMNILQGLHTDETYCVTLNNTRAIDPEKRVGSYKYSHPVHTPKVLDAQRKWGDISGKNRTHFCGAYWGYGFHEDGVNSALAVCEQFGQRLVE